MQKLKVALVLVFLFGIVFAAKAREVVPFEIGEEAPRQPERAVGDRDLDGVVRIETGRSAQRAQQMGGREG